MNERKIQGSVETTEQLLGATNSNRGFIALKICDSFCLPFRHSTGFRKVRTFVVGNL